MKSLGTPVKTQLKTGKPCTIVAWSDDMSHAIVEIDTADGPIRKTEWTKDIDYALYQKNSPKATMRNGKMQCFFKHFPPNEHHTTDTWDIYQGGRRRSVKNLEALMLVGLHFGPEMYEKRQEIWLTPEEFEGLTAHGNAFDALSAKAHRVNSPAMRTTSTRMRNLIR